MDTGATRSYITDRCVKMLGHKSTKTNILLSGILAVMIDLSNCGMLNVHLYTRMISDCCNLPDVTIAISSLLANNGWTTRYAQGPDHVSILIKLQQTIKKCKATKYTYRNFLKADCLSYQIHTERKFENIGIPKNLSKTVMTFNGIINNFPSEE